MPIYAYKCESCGHSKDVLQKMSDAPLVDCPACGAPAFKKQLTAAGFQLKGSGWYVTDFRDGKGGGDKAKESGSADKADAPANANTSASAKSEPSVVTAAPAPSSAPAASPAPAPKAAA
jgi:putative FmdB family regulatory protein